MAPVRFFVLNKEVTAGPGRTPQASIWWGGRQCPHTLLLKYKKETCFSFLSLVHSSVLLRRTLCRIISRNVPLAYCFCSVFPIEHCSNSVSQCTSVRRKGEHTEKKSWKGLPTKKHQPRGQTTLDECDSIHTEQQHMVSSRKDHEWRSSQRTFWETWGEKIPSNIKVHYLFVFGCSMLLMECQEVNDGNTVFSLIDCHYFSYSLKYLPFSSISSFCDIGAAREYISFRWTLQKREDRFLKNPYFYLPSLTSVFFECFGLLPDTKLLTGSLPGVWTSHATDADNKASAVQSCSMSVWAFHCRSSTIWM